MIEYWIVDPQKEVLEQYRLSREGTYELILKASEGIIECTPIKGFKIPIKAIFDEEVNMETLAKII